MDNQTPDKTTTKELLYYNDPRPVGKILVEKHKMPGYQVHERYVFEEVIRSYLFYSRRDCRNSYD